MHNLWNINKRQGGNKGRGEINDDKSGNYKYDGVMRGTSTFPNDNEKISGRRQDQRRGGGCHRR